MQRENEKRGKCSIPFCVFLFLCVFVRFVYISFHPLSFLCIASQLNRKCFLLSLFLFPANNSKNRLNGSLGVNEAKKSVKSLVEISQLINFYIMQFRLCIHTYKKCKEQPHSKKTARRIMLLQKQRASEFIVVLLGDILIFKRAPLFPNFHVESVLNRHSEIIIATW